MTNPFITAGYPVAVRAKLPAGVFPMYVNPGAAQTGWCAGSDSNDGLTQMTAMQHCNSALYSAHDNCDFSGNLAQTLLQINMAPGSVDTQNVHWAPHAVVGAQGGAPIEITSDGTATINPSDGTPAVSSLIGGVINLNSVKVRGVDVGLGGIIYLNNGVEFITNTGNNHINISENGQIHIGGNVNISGDSWSFLSGNGYGNFDGAGSINFLNNVNFSYFKYTSGITEQWGGITMNTNGYTVTGTRFFEGGPSISFSGNGNPNTYFPGNVDGVIWSQGGGQF